METWKSDRLLWIKCDGCGQKTLEFAYNVPRADDVPFFCEKCRERKGELQKEIRERLRHGGVTHKWNVGQLRSE